MQLPISVTFRGLPPTYWIENMVRRRVARLETFCRDIIGCHVIIEVPHRHHQEGNRFEVHIDLTVPREEIAVTHGGNLHAAARQLEEHEWVKQLDVDATRKDLNLVVKEAFDVARRRLQDYARRRRLEVKRHAEPARGRVIRWSPVDQFGRIAAADGHEVYFHVNSVVGSGLKRLRVGSPVEFVEERGDKGPQASTVKVLRGARHAVEEALRHAS